MTTPTDTVLYGYFNINTQAGPIVVVIPESKETGLWAGSMDPGQAALIDFGPAGSDEGKGGKYLFLVPDYEGEVPEGYYVARASTYNVWALLRFIPKSFSQADLDKAVEMIKKCRVYPLAQASNPPAQRHIDMAGKLYDGIVRFDETYFANLAEMVNEEPVKEQDKAIMGIFRSLEIEKGKSVQPDAEMKEILKASAEEAHQWLMANVAGGIEPFWQDGAWGVAFPATTMSSNGTFITDSYIDTDARAITYFQSIL